MTGTKTVAERLREIKGASFHCKGDVLAAALGRKLKCPNDIDCRTCIVGLASDLADAIEAEQAQAVSKALIEDVAKQENMDSGLLYNAAKDLEENAHIIKESVLEDLAHYAGLIRKALKGAKPQLPEGVIWPRFEDSELVKFGDEYVAYTGEVRTVEGVSFRSGETFVNGISRDKPMKRPEPEVLDADGVPIKVGDTVYHEDEGECVVERIYRQNGDTLLDLNICGSILNMANVKPAEVTHRKPDTQEAINQDAALLVSESFFDQRRDEFEDRVFDLLKRQRKLLGGE